MLKVLEQLELAVRPLGKHGSAEGLHDLLDGDILIGELVSGRTGNERLAKGQMVGRAVSWAWSCRCF